MKKLIGSVLVLVAILANFRSAGSQSTPHPSLDVDYRIQRLNPNGGTLLSTFVSSLDYSATLTYPAGASSVTAFLVENTAGLPIPPSLREVHLDMAFSVGGLRNFVFKGTSALKINLPTSIPNGTVLLLSEWTWDANTVQHYGTTFKATVVNNAVSFTFTNLTVPSVGDLGLTLGE